MKHCRVFVNGTFVPELAFDRLIEIDSGMTFLHLKHRPSFDQKRILDLENEFALYHVQVARQKCSDPTIVNKDKPAQMMLDCPLCFLSSRSETGVVLEV